MRYIDEGELRAAPPEFCNQISREIQLRNQNLPKWIALYLVGEGSVALHAGQFILDLGEAHGLREVLRKELALEGAQVTRHALLLDLQRGMCLIAPLDLAMAAVIDHDFGDQLHTQDSA